MGNAPARSWLNRCTWGALGAPSGGPASRRGPPRFAGARVAATCPRRVPGGSSRFGPRRFYPAEGLLTPHMDFALTETQEITRKSVRDFGERDIIPQSHAFDESQEFPHGWAKKMGEVGLFGVFVPEKYGGGGRDYVCYVSTIWGGCRAGARGGGDGGG